MRNERTSEAVARNPARPGSSQALPSAANTVRSFGPKDWLFIAALVAAVFIVYQPAWQGGFVWDDDEHITRPELRSWHGLCRIWFDVGATQQYYPLLHSAFWVQHTLWGDATLGYHLVNILLHAATAVMVALILRRLTVPGACLAAAIFALHPVHVESVAWITELKNTLSAVFYMGSAMVYLRFDRQRRAPPYLGALGLFVLGLLSKTVTATLPAALLLVFWWQRGRLAWRRDVLPLVPFLVLGTVAGVFTAWVERRLLGAEGAAFDLTIVERGLIAGRAIWFYFGKLAWPADLLFIYPRWTISQAAGWQYVFPAAALAFTAALWALRRRWRGPAAAWLFFVGTLFPVLGFCNVYPFIFSFVADHFQYLASLGIITLASAGAASSLARWRPWARPAGYALCVALLATLGGLTWRQSRMYTDAETLYRTTIAANPDCWLAHVNLGMTLAGRGPGDEAAAHYRKALEIKPDCAEAHYNLGLAATRRGQVDEAIAHYRKALESNPGFEPAHYNLGVALAGRGLVDEAITQYRKALEIKPDYVEALNNLGVALASRGQVDEAIAHYRSALKIKPDHAEAHNNLASALVEKGLPDEAATHCRKALELKPDFELALYNLANALAGRGRADEAIAHYQKALGIKPDHAEAHNNLGVALAGRGRVGEAIAHYRKALEIKPDHAEAHNNLGVALAGQGRVDEAIAHYQKALEIKPDYAGARRNLEAARGKRQ